MLINKLIFKNIQSYGNKAKELVFSTNGELILLTGENGAGKSTILNCIDIGLYGQVRGKKGKKVPIGAVVNRTNRSNGEVEINFTNNDNITIKRTIQPNTISVKSNGNEYTDEFKRMSDKDREQFIGYNFQSFRSFISLNINDFNDFINMDENTKTVLLDKMFNLSKISSYLEITNELLSQYNSAKSNHINEIAVIDAEIQRYMRLIKEERSKAELNGEKLEVEMNQLKLSYKEYQAELKIKTDRQSELLVDIQNIKNHIDVKQNDNNRHRILMTEHHTKIQLFSNDQCPYCESDLNTDKHNDILNQLKTGEKAANDRIILNDNAIQEYRDVLREKNEENNQLNAAIVSINGKMNEIKTKLMVIKMDFDRCSNENKEQEYKDKAIVINNEKKAINKQIEAITEQIRELTELKQLFSKNGIRLNIMAAITPDVNTYLQKLLRKIKYPYVIKINNDLSVSVYDRGEIINTELSSNGENRILDICIAISYIYAMKKLKTVNVLFMDELFQSIHKNNIEILLSILKDFSVDTKTNVFLIHHGLEDMNSKYFDSIIRVKKNALSYSDFEIEQCH